MSDVMFQEGYSQPFSKEFVLNNSGYFDLTQFFDGEAHAVGIFEDRFNRVKARFTVIMKGHWEDNIFVLEEIFKFDDGKTDHRVWRVEKQENGEIFASTPDCIRFISGKSKGNSLEMNYLFNLQVGSRRIKINFSDKLHQLNDKMVINRAVMRKYGIKVGELTLIFIKK